MTLAINKILASTSQAFTPAEQAQARDNISAQSKLSYAYSGNTITSIDGSAVGKINTYGYSGSTITAIDGSAIGSKPDTRWESSFQATTNTYPLLNIPKDTTALINVQGVFESCSYVNLTTAHDSWLSVSGGGSTANGGFRTWPLTNIMSIAKGGSAETGYTPMLQVVVPENTTVPLTVNMELKEM